MNLVRTLLKLPITGIQGLITLGLSLLFILNVRLYTPSPPLASGEMSPEIWAELRYLRHAIDEGAADDMQKLFPEGNFFMQILYGLAWVNVGLQSAPDSPERAQALTEARWVWEALESPAASAPFFRSPSLSPEGGIFYSGWRNYLLAGILLLQVPTQQDAEELAIFQAECEAIAQAIKDNPTPFLQAYAGQSWPVDTFPAVVSLRAHTQLVDDRYEPVIDRWLDSLSDYLDPNTTLLPHQVHPQTGHQLEGTRATSQVLILRFLYELDPELGMTHYKLFRENHTAYLWGFPGILEYPDNVRGYGDVDSGPLLQGVSLSATTVMLGTSQMYGDAELSNALWHAGEVLGMPIRYAGMKRYWFGLLPVGDAFVVWSKTSTPWLVPISQPAYQSIIPEWWRLLLNCVSLGLAVLAILAIILVRIPMRYSHKP
ncbi:MAG: hypothetical protein AAF485_12450 [Chloroflexota bacterium]